jgi:PAS domain S-box-containing protein
MAIPVLQKSHWIELGRKVEALAAAEIGETKEVLKRELDRLIHAMEMSQAEPELQHPEPTESRNTPENAEKRYKELYNKYANLFDLAPNAYLVIDESGMICEANLTAAIMFNEPKRNLVGRPMTRFIHHDDQETFHFLKQDCLQSADPHMAELKMVHSGGRHFPAQIQLQSLPRRNQAGHEFRAALLDLSEQSRISADLHLLHQCLEIAVYASDSQQLLEAYIRELKEYAQCSAVGIRLRDEAGRIPYQAYDGFSRKFYESESPLSLHNDQCMCIEIVKGRSDPAKPYFTAFGSFYINGTSRFLATVPPEELGRTRNVCNAQGYESVALIPITIDQTISGLIHVADGRENMFPLRVVEVLEQAAMRLGLALQRLHMQSRLSETVESLHELSSHLLKAKEEEQHRLAMELHDQTGQDLNVLKLRLRHLRDRLRRDQPVLKQSCTEMLTFTDQIIETVRRMTRGLNPSALEALGLRAAVKQIFREFSDYTGCSIQTDIDPLERVASRETQINLFRIIQETLTNINKHAQATRVSIKAIESEDTGAIQVVIEDNGKGFDSRKIHGNESRENGMGLAAMQLRSRMIGAQLTIQSQPGRGTCITVKLPAQEHRGIP